MASNQVGNGLYGSIKAAVVRVAKLSASCAPISGANNGAVSKAVVQLQAQAQYETGTEYTQKNGLGDILFSVKDSDKLKNLTLNLEIATRDFELIALMTGATPIVSGSYTAGLARRGTSQSAPNPVSLEVWTKVASGTGTCVTGSGQWFRTVYPKVEWTLGDTDYGASIATYRMTGVAEGNPNWGASGPFSDFPTGYTGISNFNDSPEFQFIDTQYTDPALAKGSGGVMNSAGGGYIDVVSNYT
jgi:hypothetical protein